MIQAVLPPAKGKVIRGCEERHLVSPPVWPLSCVALGKLLPPLGLSLLIHLLITGEAALNEFFIRQSLVGGWGHFQP